MDTPASAHRSCIEVLKKPRSTNSLSATRSVCTWRDPAWGKKVQASSCMGNDRRTNLHSIFDHGLQTTAGFSWTLASIHQPECLGKRRHVGNAQLFVDGADLVAHRGRSTLELDCNLDPAWGKKVQASSCMGNDRRTNLHSIFDHGLQTTAGFSWTLASIHQPECLGKRRHVGNAQLFVDGADLVAHRGRSTLELDCN